MWLGRYKELVSKLLCRQGSNYEKTTPHTHTHSHTVHTHYHRKLKSHPGIEVDNTTPHNITVLFPVCSSLFSGGQTVHICMNLGGNLIRICVENVRTHTHTHKRILFQISQNRMPSKVWTLRSCLSHFRHRFLSLFPTATITKWPFSLSLSYCLSPFFLSNYISNHPSFSPKSLLFFSSLFSLKLWLPLSLFKELFHMPGTIKLSPCLRWGSDPQMPIQHPRVDSSWALSGGNNINPFLLHSFKLVQGLNSGFSKSMLIVATHYSSHTQNSTETQRNTNLKPHSKWQTILQINIIGEPLCTWVTTVYCL